MSILLSPWFWVGLSIVAAAIAGAWFASHSTPPPALSGRVGGRPETHHDHSEYADDSYQR